MTATVASKRTVFRTIAEHPNYHWPYYRLPDTEYTAADLDALEHDVHRLASAWFKHDAHDDVEAFICWCSLHHLDFAHHDPPVDWKRRLCAWDIFDTCFYRNMTVRAPTDFRVSDRFATPDHCWPLRTMAHVETASLIERAL
jgi:hypothetical protein